MRRETAKRTAWLVCLALFTCALAGAQSRGISLEAVVGKGVTVGKQWAVFIAIDRYREWGPLQNPVKDAREIRDILRERYYIDEVRELYDGNATGEGIRRLFAGLRAQVGPDDSVFVFYAGHGYTDEVTKSGSWIPADGGQNLLAQTNWLPNIQVRNMLDALPAKHVFLVSDACFSGDILNAQRGAGPQINSEYYRQAYAKVSRQVMTSGASESVPDASEFALRLKSSLRRAEGACIDPQYLFGHAREVRQTQPLLGTIQGGEHQEGGSFLFFRRQGGAAVAVTPPVVTPPVVTPPVVTPPVVTPPVVTPQPAPRPAPAAPPEHPVPANMVRVAGGTFHMGSTSSSAYDNEKPVHQVTVKSFYMSKYEVTQKEWREVMGTTVAQQRDMAQRDQNRSGYTLRGEGDNYPMYYVNWLEAIEYCNKRSQKEGLRPAYRSAGGVITCDWSANGYRLPTEAEWEYAAKGGGLDFLEYEYSGGSNPDTVAWYGSNSGNGTHPVGTKAANSLGIYDMSGNVYEWCWDWYGAYSGGAQSDPAGAASGSDRVLRGGSCLNVARDLRSAYRDSYGPSDRRSYLGFRLVRP